MHCGPLLFCVCHTLFINYTAVRTTALTLEFGATVAAEITTVRQLSVTAQRPHDIGNQKRITYII